MSEVKYDPLLHSRHYGRDKTVEVGREISSLLVVMQLNETVHISFNLDGHTGAWCTLPMRHLAR